MGKSYLSVTKKEMSKDRRDDLFGILEDRFQMNMGRHKGIEWEGVRARIEADPGKMWSLSEMERTGGEPDVVGFDEETGEYIFYDCSMETPKDRRNVCYDRKGLEERRSFKPENNAVDMAASMGIELLTEDEYRDLQKIGEFDTRTSSWLRTPPEVRGLGGALFGDRRYGRVFVYHNGAQSYYGVRGFRGAIRI
jgi:hypothetical protein